MRLKREVAQGFRVLGEERGERTHESEGKEGGREKR